MTIVSLMAWMRRLLCQRVLDFIKAAYGYGNVRYGYIGAVRRCISNRRINSVAHKAGFAYKLSVCAIMKNEGSYLVEWIAFHAAIGVEHFYLYDNGSTDNTSRIINSLLDFGVSITYISMPGEKMQMVAYEDCVRRFSLETEWLAFIDLDEMMVPCGTDDIRHVVDRYNDYSQLVLKWAIYGSSNHITRPGGLVVENYTRRGPWNCSTLTKSIINPRMLFWPGVHQSVMSSNTKFVPVDVARVNHYHCKSREEYSLKAGKGDVAYGASAGLLKYQDRCFKEHDRNEIVDDTACRFVDKIRAILQGFDISLME